LSASITWLSVNFDFFMQNLPFRENSTSACLHLPGGLPKDLFSIEKGDTELTQAVIYKHIDEDHGFPVFGGGSGAPRFKAGKGLVKLSGEPARLFTGPALIVSMDGSSGSVQVVEKGTFYCNHHGAVLSPAHKTLDLSCFAQLVEAPLKRLASNTGGSATLTKPSLEEFQVRLPKSNATAKTIAKRRKELVALSRLTR
jgi:hypothetical protein